MVSALRDQADLMVLNPPTDQIITKSRDHYFRVKSYKKENNG